MLTLISVLGVYILNLYVEKLRMEFEIDIRNENFIEEEVIKKVDWHGVTNIELSNSKKYWIDHSRNYEYEKPFIGDNIKVGDSVFMNKLSDTLWIKSFEKVLVFVVGKSINKPVNEK